MNKNNQITQEQRKLLQYLGVNNPARLYLLLSNINYTNLTYGDSGIYYPMSNTQLQGLLTLLGVLTKEGRVYLTEKKITNWTLDSNLDVLLTKIKSNTYIISLITNKDYLHKVEEMCKHPTTLASCLSLLKGNIYMDESSDYSSLTLETLYGIICMNLFKKGVFNLKLASTLVFNDINMLEQVCKRCDYLLSKGVNTDLMSEAILEMMTNEEIEFYYKLNPEIFSNPILVNSYTLGVYKSDVIDFVSAYIILGKEKFESATHYDTVTMETLSRLILKELKIGDLKQVLLNFANQNIGNHFTVVSASMYMIVKEGMKLNYPLNEIRSLCNLFQAMIYSVYGFDRLRGLQTVGTYLLLDKFLDLMKDKDTLVQLINKLSYLASINKNNEATLHKAFNTTNASTDRFNDFAEVYLSVLIQNGII